MRQLRGVEDGSGLDVVSLVPGAESEDDAHKPRGTGAHEQPGLLELLKFASTLDIVGDVSVAVDETYDVTAWVRALPSPVVWVWRERDSGARYVQVSARHRFSPVRGVITVWWSCDGVHPFWVALLGGNDLEPGEERELTSCEVLSAAARTRVPAPPDLTSR